MCTHTHLLKHTNTRTHIGIFQKFLKEEGKENYLYMMCVCSYICMCVYVCMFVCVYMKVKLASLPHLTLLFMYKYTNMFISSHPLTLTLNREKMRMKSFRFYFTPQLYQKSPVSRLKGSLKSTILKLSFQKKL